jgi:hypothetical protein
VSKPIDEEWTDEEVLAELHKIKAAGYGRLTVEVVAYKVGDLEATIRKRKPSRAVLKPVERTAS